MLWRPLVSMLVFATVLACGIGGMQANAMPSSVEIEPQDATPIVLGAGFHTLSGHVHASSVEIGPEARVLVSSNLTLDSSGPIVVLGHIELADGTHATNRADAPYLTLLSTHSVTIRGTIHAGRGFDEHRVSFRGGAGSTIQIESPLVYVDSPELRGGDGGHGGPAAVGGAGGSVFIHAALFVTTHPEFVGYAGYGGNGGIGVSTKGLNLRGGNGGNGGSATFTSLPADDLSPAILQSLWQRNGDDGHPGDDFTGDAGAIGVPDNAPCMKGGDGGPGQAMVAGGGGHGGAGAAGTASPDGQGGYDVTPPTNGGNGGRGGHGTGGNGGRGGHGGTCCAGGVCGGNGGSGGKGTGGPAGKGGKGGNAAFTVGYGYHGAGATGGAGGVGGNGRGGHGGAGGNNGAGTPQCILRGVGGAKGGSHGGSGGDGGAKGSGNPHGEAGPSGHNGVANDGLAGAGGAPAEPCSEN